jgi:hypothetical protein
LPVLSCVGDLRLHRQGAFPCRHVYPTAAHLGLLHPRAEGPPETSGPANQPRGIR